MPKLFVFGTLKFGFPLHEQGLDEMPCLGRFRTVERYPMFVAGPWFAPMMLDQPGVGLNVQGELYDVNEGRLTLIDAMESMGLPGNSRVSLLVEPLGGGIRETAFAYVKATELAKPVHTGYLSNYRDRRFVHPDKRP